MVRSTTGQTFSKKYSAAPAWSSEMSRPSMRALIRDIPLDALDAQSIIASRQLVY